MKINHTIKLSRFLIAALLLGTTAAAFAQTTNFYVNWFPATYTYQGNTANNSQGVTPVSCGLYYGSSLMGWDGNTPDALSSPTNFSCYIEVTLNDSSGNVMEDYFCPEPYDNLFYNGNPSGVNLSEYKAVHFDIMWDTVNSTIGINQFNDVSQFAPALDNSDPNTNGVGFGLDVQVAGLGNAPPEPVTLAYVNIPNAASNGWVAVTIPINQNLSGIDGACGILFKKWISTPGDMPAGMNAFFWVGNVWFEGSAAPPPPPKLQAPILPTPGLNIYASTAGNSYYDRQQVALVASNGLSWVASATAANPVTYSFTINGFPQNPATEFGCEAYLMISPNPAAYDQALDYNEPNCIIAELQQGNGSTIMNFQDKINNAGSENFTTIGMVTNSGTALGTWSVTFTSPTNVMMTAPNGNTSSFIFTNGASFAEVNNPGCYLYLGMQANNQASLNQAVCYSKFSVTGVPSAVSDNFLADSTLNTNLWFNFMATGPGGVFVNPPGAAYWLKWSTPAGGFRLQDATTLAGPWTMPTNDITISGAGEVYQLVTTNDVSRAAPSEFFELANP